MDMFDQLNQLFEDAAGNSEYGWGLDLGTFRSSMACFAKEGHQPPIVPDYSGLCQGGMPTLFSRSASGEERIGDQVAAYDDLSNDPDSVCSSIKTRLQERTVTLSGHEYTVREILVRFIRHLKEVSAPLFSQSFIPMNIPSLVAGAPVRFTAAERGELQQIIREAMDGIPVQLVPEPILAAVAINFFLQRVGQAVNHPLLVLDMGAGTFDTVILQPNPRPNAENPYPYIALHPQGSLKAGDRIDELTTQLLLDKIREKPGKLKLDVLMNEKHQDRIKLTTVTARSLKERLSQAMEADVQISGLRCGSGMIHVTRREFEEKIADDIRYNVRLAAQVVQDSNLWGCKELEILLVGGSSYIPLLTRQLQDTFDWLEPSHLMQRLPEKAVAMGAAIYAARPHTVLPKVAYGYGVDTFETTRQKHMIHVCIPSNAKLPATMKDSYYTRFENQDCVTFRVYEVHHGEENQYLELDQGTQLVQDQRLYGVTHHFGRQVAKGTRVDLTVTLDTSGVLTLEIDDLGIKGSVTRDQISLATVCK